MKKQAFATGNTFTGCSYDYVHQNWNGGSKWLYSKVSNPSGLSDAIVKNVAGSTILVSGNMTVGYLNVPINITINVLSDAYLTITGTLTGTLTGEGNWTGKN